MNMLGFSSGAARYSCVLLASGIAAGCTTSPRLVASAANEVAVVERLAVPAGDEGVRELLARPFVLGPLDKVAMKIVGYPEFDEDELQVDSGGRLQLPLIGIVVAAGKTPGALSEELTEAYKATVLRRPSVNIAVTEVLSQRVTVEGAVRMPGVYALPGTVRLNGAIALAQGLNEFAALDNVAVFRNVDGKRYAAIFRLRDIRRGLYADPEIYPNDTIIVGESGVRRAFRDIVQTAPFVAVFRPFG